MTGKELIIYILENDLLNKPVFKYNAVVGLMTIEEAAVDLNVGKATILTYIQLKRLDTVHVGSTDFVIDNDKLKTLKERNDNV